MITFNYITQNKYTLPNNDTGIQFIHYNYNITYPLWQYILIDWVWFNLFKFYRHIFWLVIKFVLCIINSYIRNLLHYNPLPILCILYDNTGPNYVMNGIFNHVMVYHHHYITWNMMMGKKTWLSFNQDIFHSIHIWICGKTMICNYIVQPIFILF